jgi:enoyl-CoA hydratase
LQICISAELLTFASALNRDTRTSVADATGGTTQTVTYLEKRGTVKDRYGLTTISNDLGDNGVLTATLNRPESRNALDVVMHDELTKLFGFLADDPEVKVVLLCGAGGNFSIGADYKVMESNNDAGGYPDGHPGLMIGSAAIIRNLMAVRQPIVAAVRGYALGIGATLALCADIVYAAVDSHIGDPHVKAGMVAGDGGAFLWPALVGTHRAKEYLMTGKLASGVEAERIGLVNYALPDDEVMPAALAMAIELASGPSVAIQFNKRLVNKDIEARINQVFDLSLALEALTLETTDHREAVSAFLQKRKPVFGQGSPSPG